MGARNRRRRHLNCIRPHIKIAIAESHTSEKLRLQVHGIEGVDSLVIVGLDLT
jgi:hypothetical protein